MSTAILLEHLPFAVKIEQAGLDDYLTTKAALDTLQINITKRCNLACKHCHVAAGSARTEEMSHEILLSILAVFENGPFITLDVTGGAPELHPDYQWLIDSAAQIVARKNAALAAAGNAGAVAVAGDDAATTAAAGVGDDGATTTVAAASASPYATIITRTNLAILTLPEYQHLPRFWADHNIRVACSLPHYEQRNTDRQRGEGVYEAAIEGLRALNAVGYGQPESNLVVDIVVNPGGAFLPPAQASAKREYRQQLQARQDVQFTDLLTITNNPVGRFKDFLEQKGILDDYMTRLYDAFNPATVEAMMCRSQISVDVDGRLFDCDFNQVLDTPILRDFSLADSAGAKLKQPLLISDLEREGLGLVNSRQIRIGGHCYACTAGAGSSCGGATV